MRRSLDGPGGPPREGGDTIEDPTDEDFAVAARWALRQKDYRQAAQQASVAVALRPLHEPHLRLLDEVIAKARAPLEVFALPAEGAFFGLCAARARALARLERFDEALRALFNAAAFSPDTPFVPWAPAWLATAKAARRVAPETVVEALLSLAEATRGRPLSPGARGNLEAALVVAERVQARHPPSERLLAAQSRVLRALGRGEDAAARLAEAGESPGWELAVERASICGDRGDLGARARWLERARDARPREPAILLDLGDTHLADGRVDAAADAYARALALDASSVWAEVSLAYARALAAGTPCGADLLANARSLAEHPRARALQADLSAYGTRLADPVDPVVRVIRSAAEQAASSPARLRVRVRADRPLAPSARIAFSQQLAVSGRDGQLVVDHEGAPLRPGPLWRADAGGLAPAVPRPPDAVIDGVRELACGAFAWDVWCARALEISSTLDLSSAARLVDAMAHPPAPPSRDHDPVLWVHAFQVAAAVLTGLGPEPPLVRKERLCSLLAGTDDWSSAAALLGLRALASACTELRGAVLERAALLLPSEGEPLPPSSRALAVLGCELAAGEERRRFLRLRARVVAELLASNG
ncbi:uncharacterized protein SOCEGT47_002560 [Sorangium cellulosum]|uniref:Uncharacterized protein n=1 Tax=Sorangium cellulosum TaxID=56 RepID=A0A4P2PTU4_SORCE|nr:hypothetical protein [Sorangium cellulosum]AUX19803.1 uncharacterized protein SOCEGT47_002560 [Sorangium cellulosum]